MQRNLLAEMRAYFPLEVFESLAELGERASQQGIPLYLIGGSVRDMLLRQRVFDWDIDLVSETPQIVDFATHLHQEWGGEFQVYPLYQTATLRLGRLDLDFATARTECYRVPGAKPEVSCSSLADDLIRRDFTINAMALSLSPANFADLWDPFEGYQDLENQTLRALHADKFLEDPVRAWRAVRLSLALNFKLEAQTVQNLRSVMDSGCFDGFFSARILRELHKILSKSQPLFYLKRAYEFGVLRCLDPGEFWSSELELFLERVPGFIPLFDELESTPVYLYGIFGALSADCQEKLLPQLFLNKAEAQGLQALLTLDLNASAWSELSRSQVYQRLHGLPETILCTLLALPLPAAVHQPILAYVQQDRFIQTQISGKLLIKHLPAGPGIKRILWQVQAARIDQQIQTLEEETALALRLAEQEKKHAN